MTIIWCGGEDIDFTGTWVTGIHYDTLSRIAPGGDGTTLYSNTFSPITSGWVHFLISSGGYFTMNTGIANFESKKGIILRAFAGDSLLYLKKYNDITLTSLNPSLIGNTIYQFDIYLQNYSSNGNIKIYVNGVLTIDYTGDITIPDVSYFDCIQILGPGWGSGTNQIIVSDNDTRNMSLCTNYLNASGDINDFTGTYINIDEIINSDSDIIYTNTVNQKFQANLSDLPSAGYSIVGGKLVYRATKGTSGLNLQHGIKANNTEYLETSTGLTSGWKSYEKIYQVNPDTGLLFTPAEIDALQIEFKTIAE